MSEPVEGTEGAPVGDVQAPEVVVETPSEGEPVETPTDDEVAALRVAQAKSEELREAAIDKLFKSMLNIAAGDILRDPSDLPDDPSVYEGEDGLPDHDKIRAAAEQLASEKPHLARARSTLHQMQGPVSTPEAQVGLAGLLREAIS